MNEQVGPQGQLLTALPSKERAERYRQFATEAMQKAQATPDHEQRAKYLTIASGWHNVASEIERSLDSDVHGEAEQSVCDEGTSTADNEF